MDRKLEQMSLSDINLYDIGNEIQIIGTIWGGKGMSFITPAPNSIETFENIHLMRLTLPEWEQLLRQADLMETEMLLKDETGKLVKTIFRKTQRQIDSALQWFVFKRDEYSCRYCGRSGIPLTVDHIDLWELGGATIIDNLISACKKCNKDRGRMSYVDWINSNTYKTKSKNLSESVKEKNSLVLGELERLKSLRVKNIRSR